MLSTARQQIAVGHHHEERPDNVDTVILIFEWRFGRKASHKVVQRAYPSIVRQ